MLCYNITIQYLMYALFDVMYVYIHIIQSISPPGVLRRPAFRPSLRLSRTEVYM